MSPISSRKSVPPSASSKKPGVALSAPVKAPRSWPKNCESKRPEAKAEALTATNGLPERQPIWWMARATSSFPVPLSPG